MTFEDLKPFRSIKSKFTGHGESHLNPEGVLLSNGPLGSALPQSQGLALADKVAKRDRVTICTVSDGASMEGEAKEAFAAIPGLAAKGRVNPYVLVISDNDTKLSGRIAKDAYSMQPTFSAMEKLGWNVIPVPNGHDLQAVYLAVEKGIEQAKANPNSPVCLWTKTIKGYGIKATAENPTGGHGFPLPNGEKIVDWINEIYGGQPPEEFLNWAQALRLDWEQKEAAKKAKAAAGPAPGATAVKKDKVQSGLAKAVVRAADGASHEATTYLAATSAIPHTIVIAPSCADEAESLMYQAIKRYAADRAAGKDGETCIFFVGRENYPIRWVENGQYQWGKAQVLKQGNDVVLIGCGPLLSQAIATGKDLAAKGVEATVINNPFINRVDLDMIGTAVKRCGGRVVTIEDHQVIGGMGAQISHALSQAGIAHRMRSEEHTSELQSRGHLVCRLLLEK